MEDQEWIQENNELEGQRVEEIENPEWNPREEAQVENLGEELVQMTSGGEKNLNNTVQFYLDNLHLNMQTKPYKVNEN